jgi:hypothetical protein
LKAIHRIRSRPALSPAHRILIGTHHKTGTVWLKKLFAKACDEFDLRFYASYKPTCPADTQVFLQSHSQFEVGDLQQGYRGMHIIRDPRDRMVSGCFYHQKSSEQWLHVAKPEFGGLTYHEKINSYDSFADKLLFEMENSGAVGLREMLEWNYDDPNFIEVKYEQLIVDKDLTLFHKIFSFLGIPGANIPDFLRIAYENSLFSGQVRKSAHIRSGTSSQWMQHFLPIHKERFLQLFPNALIKLQYEVDDSWAIDDRKISSHGKA